ncbi:MAG: hypothetical protein V3T64_12015 [Myxococcota bacterium]
MTQWMLVLAVVATLAIFATTNRGRELVKRLGFRDRVKGAASSEDVAYLLDACGGDLNEVARRIELERSRVPELSEAEHYRRAIRKVFAERQA